MLIFLNNITPKSNIEVKIIKEVITLTEEALGYESSSPCQHLQKCIENDMEIIHTSVGF